MGATIISLADHRYSESRRRAQKSRDGLKARQLRATRLAVAHYYGLNRGHYTANIEADPHLPMPPAVGAKELAWDSAIVGVAITVMLLLAMVLHI